MSRTAKVGMMALLTLMALCLCCACNDVTIDGKKYDKNTASVSITDLAFDDYALLCKKLPRLEKLDLTALPLSPAQYNSIVSQTDQAVRVIWNVPIGEKRYPNMTETLTLSDSDLSAAADVLPYFYRLKDVTVDSCELSEALGRLAESVYAQNATFHGSSEVCGVVIDSTTEKVNLNRKKVSDPALIRLALQVFPNIKTFEMCDCGLGNDVMGQLREDYPHVTFIWVVRFERFAVRTDAQVFSTLEYEKVRAYDENTFAPLFRYCTELRALDVGHHGIVDISGIANLKKLQVLILGDNYIRDISPLAELKDLYYLELFENRIKDVSPLVNNQNLMDLCVMYNTGLQNTAATTAKLPHLKRLYLSNCGFSKNEVAEIRKGLPKNCEINSKAPSLSEGWRWNERTIALRNVFSKWDKVKEFRQWDDVVYQ